MQTLFGPAFPPTRYQGSKRKLAAAILAKLESLEYETVLDAFGGTGAMAYEFKKLGKAVTYNDDLRFNQQIGLALIENDAVQLTDEEVAAIATRQAATSYPDFIESTFEGIYFTREENRWLDTAVVNIAALDCRYKRALAWFAVFQAALAKRPYNLFHRRNLYMRTADIPRGFGNKASWDRSFQEHFRRFVREANEAVFVGEPCRACCFDVLEVPGQFDLVYVDPPYLNRHGVGVDYRAFYHFLEGMVQYDDWPGLIDPSSKHRGFRRAENPWCDPERVMEAFRLLIGRFRGSTLVVSYRSNGAPSIDDLAALLRTNKKKVRVHALGPYQYALSTARDNREVLLVAT